MKRVFLLLFALVAVASGAPHVLNKVGYTDSNFSGVKDAGDTYNGTWTQGRITFKLVEAGLLPSGASVWIKNGSGGYWLQTTVAATGKLNVNSFVATMPSPHGTNSGSIKVGVQATWGTGPDVTRAIFARSDVLGNQGGAPKYEDSAQTIIIYPPNFEHGVFNVELHSRTKSDAVVDYMLVWDGDERGQIARMPAANPREGFTQLWMKTVTVGGEAPIDPLGYTLYRRTAGGSWLVLGTGTVPVGDIVTIIDDPQGIIAEVPTPEQEPPETGDFVNTNGQNTGTGSYTAGNGITYQNPPSSTGGGGTGGTGGGTGGGEGGGEEETDSRTLDLPAHEDTDGKKTTVDNYAADVAGRLNSTLGGMQTLGTKASQMLTGAGAPVLPTISAGAWSWKIPVAVSGSTVDIDLNPYRVAFEWLRKFLVFTVGVVFWVKYQRLINLRWRM